MELTLSSSDHSLESKSPRRVAPPDTFWGFFIEPCPRKILVLITEMGN